MTFHDKSRPFIVAYFILTSCFKIPREAEEFTCSRSYDFRVCFRQSVFVKSLPLDGLYSWVDVFFQTVVVFFFFLFFGEGGWGEVVSVGRVDA